MRYQAALRPDNDFRYLARADFSDIAHFSPLKPRLYMLVATKVATTIFFQHYHYLTVPNKLCAYVNVVSIGVAHTLTIRVYTIF